MTNTAFLSALLAAFPARAGRPTLVAVGSPVDAVYKDDELTIRSKGTAIASGAEGDEVVVQLDDRRYLRGVVTGANTVLVM